MSPIHKTDDYNFAQPSRSGHAGFESFKEEGDGRFYFHFNDNKGVALLFSQAYRRETDRDKGIQSVIKNAVVDTQFERHTTEGGCFFILRAANGQEIARSRVFASLIELEEKRTFLSKNWALSADNPMPTKTTLVEVPAATTNAVVTKQRPDASAVKSSSVILTTSSAAENVSLKNKIGILEAQLAALQNSASAIKDLSDDPLRQVFRIEVYKSTHADRIHGKIIHPFSEETKAFSGFDSDTILGFMSAKLNLDWAAETVTEVQTNQTIPSQAGDTPPQYLTPKTAVEPAPIKPLQAIAVAKSPVKVINLSNASAKPRPNQPFALVLSALPNERHEATVGQSCLVEIDAFNIDTRERYRLLEKRLNVTTESDKQDIGVRIEPLVLNTGNYRLNLVVHLLANKNALADIPKWQGSSILQIY